jgi:hypothetical protein
MGHSRFFGRRFPAKRPDSRETNIKIPFFLDWLQTKSQARSLSLTISIRSVIQASLFSAQLLNVQQEEARAHCRKFSIDKYGRR